MPTGRRAVGRSDLVTTAGTAAEQVARAPGRRWLARVQVSLKPVVNDPAGISIAEALRHLGFEGLESVRAGKYFEIELRAPDRAAAEAQADQMCRQLLANPVVEEYVVTVGQARGRE
ncbi:MAG: phosphoribosylformylglycinamidine synthase subunit PurS [Chloroflexi bacterium]|nr:phosphoribosylformylglycinamidine synthase subunit PurS [Chloroflexota bacterium]